MKKTNTAIAALSLGLAIFAPIKASAATTNRLAGINRYETSVQISKTGWTSTSKYAVIATGDDFPDALCAAPLAKKYDAPILLTGKDSLLSNVKDEVKRLGVEQVYIVGGTGAISDKVKSDLESMNIKCTRFFGKDRYETSEKVAEQINSDGSLSDIAVVTGADFPDALSISSIAAEKSMPILLTGRNDVPDAISQYLKGKSIKNTYVIGGSDVVSDDVAEKLQNVTRLQGNDRYDTNIKVLDKFSTDLNFNSVYIATGNDYPDALAASALASKSNSPLCLVSNSSSNNLKSNILLKKIEDNSNIINNVTAIGGTAALSNDTLSFLGYTYPLDNTFYPFNNIVSSSGSSDYYIKPSSMADGTGGIYKISKSGTTSTAVIRDTIDTTLKRIEKKSNINVVSDLFSDTLYYENVIYDFSDSETSSLYTEGIYKVNSDGSGKTKICSDNARETRVSGNSVYYINGSDKGKPYKINLDGSGKTKLSNDENSYDLTISGGNAYYLSYVDINSPRQLFKAKLDGTGSTKIATDKFIKYMQIDGNTIYFIADSFTESRIYKMNLDGTGEVKLFQAPASDHIASLYVTNGTIYYFDNPAPSTSNYSTLYKISSDGQSTLIKDKLSWSGILDITADKIYFTQNNSISRMNLDGSGLETLK